MTGSAVFFDVDGVLIDSLEIKGSAFADLFADEFRSQILAFHSSNGGMSRLDKIARMSAEIAGVELPPEVLEGLVERYAKTVREAVVAADEILGAAAALTALSVRFPLHAVSAVPGDELTYVLAKRGVLHHFASVHGTPPTKAETLDELIRINCYSPMSSVFVGDSVHDYDAASECGVPFVFVRSGDQPVPFGSEAVATDLRDMESIVTDLLATRRP